MTVLLVIFSIALGVAAGNVLTLWAIEHIRRHEGIDLSPFRITINLTLPADQPNVVGSVVGSSQLDVVWKKSATPSKRRGGSEKGRKLNLSPVQRRHRSLLAKRQKRKGGKFG